MEFLDQSIPAYSDLEKINALEFKKDLIIHNLWFKYAEDGPWILKNLNISIVKGSRVGFIGVTGSGKSTLLDVIMGLLEPTEGRLLVDDVIINSKTKRSWQLNIAHVPQSIFLSDSTIFENIAFGIEANKIDMEKVKIVAKKAQISDHIESLKDGYNTIVGERGVRLSGGQRQRIGIARALYKEASVIIFDEATSALDNETEKAVMDAIDGLGRNLTILIIAHRLSTVKNCDKIIELKDGSVVSERTSDDSRFHI